tara:strand:+ start:12577 stop:13470 length:894 start_codon:yes stop_codon:yes gene_type:complete
MTTLPNGKIQQHNIILAVGNLAKGASISVRSSEVKVVAFTLMGIDPTEFDGKTIGNETKARNPCDLAFNRNAEKLKKSGHLVSGGRGKYALTELGWNQYATATSGHEIEAGTVGVAPVQIQEPKPKRAVRSQATVSSMHKVTVMAGGAQLATPSVLREDAHLLNMQKSNSPCFGVSFTNNSKVCGRCPIAGMCQRKRMGGLANLASLVKRGVADGNLGVVLGLVEPVVETPEPVVEEKQPVKVDDSTVIEKLLVEIDGVPCDHCGQPIEKGTNGYILANIGICHEHCVEHAQAQGGA